MSIKQFENTLTTHPILPWLIFLLGLLSLYGGTLGFGFTYDDVLLVRSYSCDELIDQFSQPWSDRFYRPVVNFIFAGEYVLFAQQAWCYHLVNLLLISVILYLFYRLMLRLFDDPAPALLSGLLWMALPGNAVLCTWISTRTDTICLLFYLLSLSTYMRAVRVKQNHLLFYALSLCFAGLAYLSKESAVTLPFLLTASILFLDSSDHQKRPLSLIPHYTLWLGYLLMRWWVLGARMIGERGLSQETVVSQNALISAAGMVVRYFEALISSVYPVFLMPNPLTALLLIVVIVSFLFMIRRRNIVRKEDRFMALWILITAATNVFDASPRLLWLPTLGSAYLMVVLACRSFSSAQFRLRLMLIILIYLLAMLEINGMVQNCFTQTTYQSTLQYEAGDRRRWPFSDLGGMRYELRQKILQYLETHRQNGQR